MRSVVMTRSLLAIVACLALFATAFSASTDEDTDPVPDADAVMVGEDAIADWHAEPDLAQIGHLLGQDLLTTHIDIDPDVTDFVIEVTYLPGATGGVPEATRYTWNFVVDGQDFELDGKFTNYSRGACDPTSGQCDPANGNMPRDPGEAPFLLRGNCATNDANVTLCEELALIHAEFDPRARTITIPVGNELLGLAPCTTISGGANLFGGSISAAPSAFFTSSVMPMDTMLIFEVAQVPSGDPENPCEDA